MKLSNVIFTGIILFFACCKKESSISPVIPTPTSYTIDSSEQKLPYHIRYKTYRQDFDLMYSNYLNRKNNEGC
ncbi:MAG: hypothetical protein V4565_05045 [Bacteroidota bacterium]